MINAVAPELIEDEPMPKWLEVQLLESLEQVKQGKTVTVEEFSERMQAKFAALAAAVKTP